MTACCKIPYKSFDHARWAAERRRRAGDLDVPVTAYQCSHCSPCWHHSSKPYTGKARKWIRSLV